VTTLTRALLVALAVITACQAERQPVGGNNVALSAPWSRPVALAVLQRAVDVEDDVLRAEAWTRWIESGDPSIEPLLGRAVMDPSPLVQQSLAKHHADRVGDALINRAGADPVALAWLALQGHKVPAPPGDLWATLFFALQGHLDAQDALLAELRAGPDVLEPGVIEILGRSGISGMADALMTGAEQVDSVLGQDMQLAALGLGHGGAADTLLAVDAPLQAAAWGIEIAVRHPTSRATERLQRLARASDHPLALHARLGLMALGRGTSADGVEGLKHRDRDTRSWAAVCLRGTRMDRTVLRDEITLLQGSTRDESSRVRVESVKTLVALAGVESVPLRPPYSDDKPRHVDVIIASSWLAVSGIQNER